MSRAETYGKIAFLSEELVNYIRLARLYGISVSTEAADASAALLPANGGTVRCVAFRQRDLTKTNLWTSKKLVV